MWADWLSRLLEIMPVTGRVEIRCAYESAWRVTYEKSPIGEIPYHVVLSGRAVLENPASGTQRQLRAGDIVLLTHGSGHVLHDGSGTRPKPPRERPEGGYVVSETSGTGERLDMLCGRFVVAPTHGRLLRAYLPECLVVGTSDSESSPPAGSHSQLQLLVQLLRTEVFGRRVGAQAMLNSLSATLFALAVRIASEIAGPSTGLLAMAAHPRLVGAMAVMLQDPARPWTLPELAARSNMSRATFIRQVQASLGRSAFDLLTDVRMAIAANSLSSPSASTESVAFEVGYKSVSAFRQAFARRLGVTPGAYRRSVVHR
jgi:AraC family transcriptional regulator, activator of mtrCDE